MKPGDLIAVYGDLYEYEGIEQAEYTRNLKMHRVYEVDIDEDGNLTNTYNPWYFTDEELTEGNKPNFTNKQWCGIIETLIRNDYDLTDDEITDAAEDIVYREFAILGIPTVEELNRRIETYMNR